MNGGRTDTIGAIVADIRAIASDLSKIPTPTPLMEARKNKALSYLAQAAEAGERSSGRKAHR